MNESSSFSVWTAVRLLGAAFGLIYGALAGACIPIVVIGWVAERLMSEPIGTLGLVFTGLLLPIGALTGSLVGGVLGWFAANAFVLHPRSDRGHQGPTKNLSHRANAGLVAAFMAVAVACPAFVLLDSTIPVVLGLVLPEWVDTWLGIQLGNPLPLGVEFSIHSLDLGVSFSLGLLAFRHSWSARQPRGPRASPT